MSDVESHEPDLDEVEKVGSQFLGCAKVRVHLLYKPLSVVSGGGGEEGMER